MPKRNIIYMVLSGSKKGWKGGLETNGTDFNLIFSLYLSFTKINIMFLNFQLHE